MQAALDGLPCTVPGWPAGISERLRAFGLHHLGDLTQVPTAGLRRRLLVVTVRGPSMQPTLRDGDRLPLPVTA